MDVIDFEYLTVHINGLHFIGADLGFSGTGSSEVRASRTATGWTIQVDSNGDRKIDMAIDVTDKDHVITWDSSDFQF